MTEFDKEMALMPAVILSALIQVLLKNGVLSFSDLESAMKSADVTPEFQELSNIARSEARKDLERFK
ncbi:MAG TPA: hypothetical protein PLK13_11880 [Xanthobacteraceae bacterium]|nr:hypothetical protein [Xanthobacteraceae bacterium]HQS46809.1 hypothetical protein [Xanthobacteraceae bacterium]